MGRLNKQKKKLAKRRHAPKRKRINEILDIILSIEEIRFAIKTLKNGKASGKDKIIA